MTRGHKFEYHSSPIVSSGIYSSMYRESCAAFILLVQITLKWRDVIEYIIYLGCLINISFWLSWSLGKQMVIAPGYIIIVGLCTSILLITYFLISGLLFPKFRFGWKLTLHCIPQKLSSKASLNTFMVVAVKGDSSVVDELTLSFDHSSIGCNGEQVIVFLCPWLISDCCYRLYSLVPKRLYHQQLH